MNSNSFALSHAKEHNHSNLIDVLHLEGNMNSYNAKIGHKERVRHLTIIHLIHKEYASLCYFA